MTETKEKKGKRIITTSNLQPKKQRERDTFLSTHDLPINLPQPKFDVEKEETEEKSDEETKK